MSKALAEKPQMGRGDQTSGIWSHLEFHAHIWYLDWDEKSWALIGAVAWTTYMCPLHMPRAFPNGNMQKGNVPHEPGESCMIFSELASRSTQPLSHRILLVTVQTSPGSRGLWQGHTAEDQVGWELLLQQSQKNIVSPR